MSRAYRKSPHHQDTASRDAKIVRLWNERAQNGLNKKRLAERFGLTYSALARILNEAEAQQQECP